MTFFEINKDLLKNLLAWKKGLDDTQVEACSYCNYKKMIGVIVCPNCLR